jgi:hypothetical protein
MAPITPNLDTLLMLLPLVCVHAARTTTGGCWCWKNQARNTHACQRQNKGDEICFTFFFETMGAIGKAGSTHVSGAKATYVHGGRKQTNVMRLIGWLGWRSIRNRLL